MATSAMEPLERKAAVLVLPILALLLLSRPTVLRASSLDCWNPDRLKQMKIGVTDEERRDPNLAQFSNLMKCLRQEQGKADGLDMGGGGNGNNINSNNNNNMDWRQWQTFTNNENLKDVWKNNRDRGDPAHMGPGGQGGWPNQNRNNPYDGPNGMANYPPRQPQPGQQGQPRPGVHPDDWDRDRSPGWQNPGRNPDPYAHNDWSIGGGPPPQQQQPPQPVPGGAANYNPLPNHNNVPMASPNGIVNTGGDPFIGGGGGGDPEDESNDRGDGKNNRRGDRKRQRNQRRKDQQHLQNQQHRPAPDPHQNQQPLPMQDPDKVLIPPGIQPPQPPQPQPQPPPPNLPGNQPQPGFDGGGGQGLYPDEMGGQQGIQGGTDVLMINTEDTSQVALTRKYDYAIMALAVVALAILMVITIFCCNSSNSTMSQPATQATTVVGHGADNYSIYSYKQGMNDGSETLRSTGTLGDTLRTQTLQSRASPQYRVSDIDPDFARRFREDAHHSQHQQQLHHHHHHHQQQQQLQHHPHHHQHY